MADNMTDKQFEKILKMVEMILDGCKDLDEAKAKVKELTEDQKKKSRQNSRQGTNRGAAGLPPKPQTVYIDIIARKCGKVNIIQYGGSTNGADNERVPERIF